MTFRRVSASTFALVLTMFLVVPMIPSHLCAQSGSGQIRLQVKDPSARPMAASGRIVGLGNAVNKSFQTDAQGRYTFGDLAAATYRIEIARAGFAAQSLSVSLPAGSTVSQTVTMTLMAQATHVDVVGATPLAGTDLPLDQIPSPVQTVTAYDIQQTDALDLAGLLNRRLTGVFINENQENPFQPDVNYRGYTASPLLGTPEGLSIYMDGVRQNQPFGDIVNWDLIPKQAISDVALMPGSNPLFGLNTLGGAISVQTKDGFSAPGSEVEVSGGSFGRREIEFENGGSLHNGFNWYGSGNLFHEDGWRVSSPSDVRQAFGKVGWRNAKTAVFLSGGYADNELHGNGLQDFRLLNQNYSSVYSVPDITWDRSPFATVSLRRDVTNNLTLSGNIYFRHVRTDTNNGDINEESFDQSLYNLSAADITALRAAGYSGFPATGNASTEPFPFWRCIAQGLEKDEPIEKCTGINTRTSTRQNNYGLSGQASWRISRHRITTGASWDRSNMTYAQESQFGYLNPDRITLTLIDAFADGSTTQDGVPVDTRVNLHGLSNTYSLYATDTISLTNSVAITVSGRYNHTSITNQDRLSLDPTGARGSLNGHHEFDRFNPAAGLVYSPVHFATLYFNYSEANRAPTSIELGCADPSEPCNLPNALVSDPPLKQVVARTFEVGARNAQAGKFRWNIDFFHMENYNDLLFVASEQTGFGFFDNFGKTRRQGVEAAFDARVSKFVLGASYTFLAATYQSPQLVDGGSNSTNDGGLGMDGNIAIAPGDRIPEIPQHMFKAYVDFQPVHKLTVDFDLRAISSSYARGDENNLDQPDGTFYLGAARAPSYAVVDFGARYQFEKHMQLFAQIDNLFNTRYYSAAQLGPTPYDNNLNFVARPFPARNGDFPIRSATFFAPGATIGAWGGVRVRF